MKGMVKRISDAKLRVAVLGEEMRDRWVFGQLTRINPEAPTSFIFQEKNHIDMPGGAASLVRSLRSFGCEVRHVKPEGITAIKTRYATVDGQIIFRADQNEDVPPLADGCQFLFERHPRIASILYIIISDYGRGFLQGDVVQELMDNYSIDKKNTKVRVIYSPHVRTCRSMDCLGGEMRPAPNWIWIVNDAEEIALREAGVWPTVCIVTRGAQPVELWEGRDLVRSFLLPALVGPRAHHTCAIGDVFLAGFAAAYFATDAILSAVDFANLCCARVLSSARPATHYIETTDLR